MGSASLWKKQVRGYEHFRQIYSCASLKFLFFKRQKKKLINQVHKTCFTKKQPFQIVLMFKKVELLCRNAERPDVQVNNINQISSSSKKSEIILGVQLFINPTV